MAGPGERRHAPRGTARREAILRAAVDLIGEQGPDALTHRAVAERAGVSLSATTYWFSSKEEIFREAVALAAGEEVERLEGLVLELAPRNLAPAAWARELSAALAADVRAIPPNRWRCTSSCSRPRGSRRCVTRWPGGSERTCASPRRGCARWGPRIPKPTRTSSWRSSRD